MRAHALVGGVCLVLLACSLGAEEDQTKLRADYARIVGKEAAEAVPEDHTFSSENYQGAFSRDKIKTITVLDADGVTDGIQVEKEPYSWRVLRAIPWVKGVRHGTEFGYAYVKDDKGKDQRIVILELPWDQGKINGTKLTRHSTGKVQSEVAYVDGELEGVGKTFDEQGRLQRETTYIGGKRQGEVIEYHTENGTVKRRLPYERGEIHGTVEEFYSDGSIKRRIDCRHGAFHGIEEEFAADGTLRARRYWLDDERVEKAAYQAAASE